MIKNDRPKCQALLGYLSDYVDGDLSQDLCDEIENHLAGCQDCTIVVDTLRKTISLYHSAAAEAVELPRNIRERLYHTLRLEDYLNR